MEKRIRSDQTHSPQDIVRALSLFFAVRGVIRTKFSQGKKLDPSTWLQIETMKFIADHGEPKMKEVANYLSITAPSATTLVGGLVKNGLVICETDRRDRRSSRLALTKKGKNKLEEATTRGIQLLSGLFAIVSKKELAAFVGVLERIKKMSDGHEL
jgi:DNA-binding MarR family transcriptional regulator